MSPVRGMVVTAVSVGGGVLVGDGVGLTVGAAVGELTMPRSGEIVGWNAGELGRQPSVKNMTAVRYIYMKKRPE